jgi:adenine-specific DNA-methyltransferase
MPPSLPIELKEQIQTALAAFATKPLPQAARALFDTLGYNSQRDERVLKIATPADFIGWVKSANPANTLSDKDQQELITSFKNLNFLFQLTDVEVGAALGQGQTDLFDSHTAVDGSRIESYLFFAAELNNDNHQSRTAMSRLTRLINKPLPMPAMILFRQGATVTLAVINRRLHKRDGSRDVLEKVTLIKDISFAKPHRAHIEILHDLAVASLKKVEGITSFVTLHNAWRKVLDTSALNKRFYREIADWYFWAVKEVQFPLPPTNKLAADPTNNSTSVIRLLTRLIFTWFLKEKGLVPDCLFDEKQLCRILNKFDPQNSQTTYYRAILQNLFFATLNAEMNRDAPGNRRFVLAETGDINKQKTEYGIKNIFRYADLFAISKDEAVRLFDDIPFLNGGLFDCLDKEDDNGKVIYLDGFTRNPKLQPVVPDYLFFSDFRTIDLSGDYGDKKRAQEKVRGLVSILRDYKFTVAENTPIEEEVALDPELLGNVFENLLASYNPETGVTARKLTGSFYTPRMIVNYMVDGALQAYLLQKLLEKPTVYLPVDGNQADMFGNQCKKGQLGLMEEHGAVPVGAEKDKYRAAQEDKLDALIAWNDLPSPFSPEETAILIEAIHTLKTLDPAVGSGAFPMGLLHKMVHILHKLDPDNARWKQAQLDAADRMPDPAIRHDLIAHIEDAFDPKGNQADYGRKLFLIQNCIYGVDIQPIAVQIAKLRFFISLVVDQKVNDKKKNRGVLALPNLETRFVAANTLLGIDKPEQGNLFIFQIRAKEADLRSVRSRHFDARTRQEKLKCMADDKRIRKEIAGLLEQDNYPHDKAVRLSDWNPYDQNKSADFFDVEWMFGIVDGFNISIGNPPYVRADAGEEHLALRQRILESKQYETLWEKWDLFIPFIEFGYKVLKANGVTTMIVSDAYCHSKYAQKSQTWFLKNSRVMRLDFLSKIKVFDAGVHNIVYFFQKADGATNRPERHVHEDDFGKVRLLPTDEQKNLTLRAFFPDDNSERTYAVATVVLDDICYISYGLRPSSDENDAKGEFTTADLVRENPDKIHCKAFVEGKHLDIWLPASNLWLEWGTDRAPAKFCRPTFPQLYEVEEKILAQRSPGPDPKVCLDTIKLVFSPSSVGFVLWHTLSGVRNNSLKKRARYMGEKPPRPDLPQREELEKTSRRFAVKYLLAVMNSAFAKNFLRANRRSNIHLYPDDWKQLPIPDVPPEKQAPIVALVELILAAKKSPPAPLSQRGEQTDIPALEAEIDRLVYALYGLTDEEFAVVEGKK